MFSRETTGKEILDLAIEKSNDFGRDECGCRFSDG